MKAKIPVWINGLQGVILAILAFQTYAGYLNPALLYPGFVLDSATAKIIYGLAGRNAVMLVISLIALARQNPRFYAFTFLMHGLREAQDMVIMPLTGGPGMPAVAIVLVFLVIFVIPEIFAYLKLNRMANQMEKLA